MPTQKPSSRQTKKGVIVKFNDDAGVAYVKDKELNRQYIFGYDKIGGYAGQAAEEISLNPGKQVHFTLEDEIIKSVDLS